MHSGSVYGVVRGLRLVKVMEPWTCDSRCRGVKSRLRSGTGSCEDADGCGFGVGKGGYWGRETAIDMCQGSSPSAGSRLPLASFQETLTNGRLSHAAY